MSEKILESLELFLSEDNDGRLIAATNQAPYLFFKANTKEDLVDKVSRGLSFYVSALEAPRTLRRRDEVALSDLGVARRMRASEFIAA